MLTADDLKRYKLQNPVKYEQKYGDKTIAEILGMQTPAPESNVKSEFITKKEVEVPLETIDKPKRGRRKKNE